MAKSRDSYRVTGQTAPELSRELNFLLQRVADRMDKMEGIRGDATIESDLNMSDHKVRQLATPTAASDGARLGDVPQDDVTFGSVTADVILVNDADGNLIHSLGFSE